MINRYLLMLTIITSLSYSQSADSLKEALKYYPLHIGDYWQYEVKRYWNLPNPNPDSTWYASKEIIADTIMDNNLKYYTILTEGFYNWYGEVPYKKSFIRIDSSSGLVLSYNNNSENRIDSLLAQKDDIIDFYQIKDIYEKELFGLKKETKFYDQNFISMSGSNSREMTKDFGLTSQTSSDITVFLILDKYELTYAKINGVEYGTLVDVKSESETITNKFSLSQNYPNPFNPSTTIEYSIPFNVETHGHASLQLVVYDVLGKEVATLVNQQQKPGNYKVTFDNHSSPSAEGCRNLASGVYYYRLKYGSFVQTKKMILLK